MTHIIDQYIDSLFDSALLDEATLPVIQSSIAADKHLVPTFQAPTLPGQSMLMAQQLLALLAVLPESRLRQACLASGWLALQGCHKPLRQTAT